MAQLRQRKSELESLGALLYCVLPMDLYRTNAFQKRSAGPFTTLSDPAGQACAKYGIAKQLVVHDEWVNSPVTFVIDRKGIVRYAYVGDYWGARPSADTVISEVKKLK